MHRILLLAKLPPDPAAMRNYAADPRPTRPVPTYLTAPTTRTHPVDPADMADWLRARHDALVRRWHRELCGRSTDLESEMKDLLEEFLDVLASLLPPMIGRFREQVEPLWIAAAELFGATAARRGLAAGEVIEEFQLLRHAIIRFLYADPPLGGDAMLSLREVLRLNRAIDRGVAHASVGHTDALFFALLEGSGVPHFPHDGPLVAEVRDQLAQLRDGLASATAIA